MSLMDRKVKKLGKKQEQERVQHRSLSKKEQQEYLHITVENSKKNLKLLAFGIVIFESILLVIFFLRMGQYLQEIHSDPGFWTLAFYPIMYAENLLISLIVLIMILHPRINLPDICWHRTFFFYIALLILWGIVLSYGDILIFHNTGSGVYIQVILFAAVFACVVKLSTFIMLFLSSYVLYFIGLLFLESDLAVLFTHGVNDTISTVLAVFILYILHVNRLSMFKSLWKQHRLNEELEEQEKILHDMSMRDDLTGIYNRRYLYAHLKSSLDDFLKTRKNASLFLFDIDNFKAVNDNYGHTLGDDILRRVSTLITQEGPEDAIAARFGGDEFCVLMPGIDIGDAEAAARGYAGSIGQRVCFGDSPEGVSVTISGGLADLKGLSEKDLGVLGGHGELTVDKWYALVDTVLYQAKAAGKHRIFKSGDVPAENDL
ncbi:MAG: GGDEF domain-containing protein [Spirochaetales bacterium]|nr:GGDEF domain-containing protein [Spirochaetales bacterium]